MTKTGPGQTLDAYCEAQANHWLDRVILLHKRKRTAKVAAINIRNAEHEAERWMNWLEELTELRQRANPDVLPAIKCSYCNTHVTAGHWAVCEEPSCRRAFCRECGSIEQALCGYCGDGQTEQEQHNAINALAAYGEHLKQRRYRI